MKMRSRIETMNPSMFYNPQELNNWLPPQRGFMFMPQQIGAVLEPHKFRKVALLLWLIGVASNQYLVNLYWFFDDVFT